jgi:hypothetical protein
VGRPVGRCVRGPSPTCAIAAFAIRVLSLRSRPFAWSGRRRVDEAIRCRQLRANASRRTSRPTPFQRRGCRTPLGPSRTSWSLDRTAPTSDALIVARRHARDGLFSARCADRDTLLADGDTNLTYEPKDSASPCRSGHDGQEPESAFRRIENSRAETHEPRTCERLTVRTYPRTVSPSLHPCAASGSASGFLRASALVAPRDLAISRRRRRAMRPTDVCHPYDLRAPVPRAFLVRSAAFTAWTSRGVWAPRDLPGDRTFHDVRDRFGGSSPDT